MRSYVNINVWWHIYMVECERTWQCRPKVIKSKLAFDYLLNRKHIYYTGITMRGIGKRFGDYLYRRGKNGYINTQWKNSIKRPVYVEYLYGKEWDAMQREKRIKRMPVAKKKLLIKSEENMLVKYVPLKAIVLKKNDKTEEHIVQHIS